MPMSWAMWEGSFLYGWPRWILNPICALWNAINCMRFGHQDYGDVQEYKEGREAIGPNGWYHRPPTCVNCCSELPVDGVYVRDLRPRTVPRRHHHIDGPVR